MGIRQNMGHWALRAALAAISVTAAFTQSALSAQEQTIVVEGMVTNSGGEAVAGASVILEGKGQTNSQQTKTNAEGKFRFSASSSGTYAITAEKSGIRSQVIEPLELSAGAKKTVRIIIDNAAASASPGEMEFADEPNFTVAGVTDWSGAGGHGSDTSLRTSESLTRETMALKPRGTEVGSASAAEKSAEAHRLQGELDERSGDPLRAVHEFELAATLDPSEQNYFEWGTELLLHRASSPAVVVFKKGTLAHRTSARMLTGLGAALYAGGSYEEAASQLCRASDLEPENPTPYLFLGKVEITAVVALPCGEQKLARFLQQQPGNALANYYFAMVLLNQGREATNSTRIGKAQELLEKAVAIDPKLGEGYLQLGILYAGEGANDRAIADYIKAVEVSPGISEPHYRLSQIYKRIGEKTKAEQEIQLYRAAEKQEADEAERQRREVQQFLIILKAPGAVSPR
jgi:Flp pilus assembly protein TadD